MEIHEQSAALVEHITSENLTNRLAEQFGVEMGMGLECLKRIVGLKANLETGLWSLYQKEDQFFLVREKHDGTPSGRLYRVFLSSGKRFDKSTQTMVEKSFIDFERSHLRPEELTIRSKAGSNETGHYLPSSSGGRR